MKHTVSLILILCMLFALVACSAPSTPIETPQEQQHVHSFGNWAIIKTATCTEPGLQERSCSCGEKQTQTIAATGHSFGEWSILKQPTYTEEGLKIRYCSCGNTQTEIIEKKESQKVSLTVENFRDYFHITYDYVYDEYSGKIFNYGTIDGTVTCAQAVNGVCEHVSVTLELYPRGGQWDVTNFTSDDRCRLCRWRIR